MLSIKINDLRAQAALEEERLKEEALEWAKNNGLEAEYNAMVLKLTKASETNEKKQIIAAYRDKQKAIFDNIRLEREALQHRIQEQETAIKDIKIAITKIKEEKEKTAEEELVFKTQLENSQYTPEEKEKFSSYFNVSRQYIESKFQEYEEKIKACQKDIEHAENDMQKSEVLNKAYRLYFAKAGREYPELLKGVKIVKKEVKLSPEMQFYTNRSNKCWYNANYYPPLIRVALITTLLPENQWPKDEGPEGHLKDLLINCFQRDNRKTRLGPDYAKKVEGCLQGESPFAFFTRIESQEQDRIAQAKRKKEAAREEANRITAEHEPSKGEVTTGSSGVSTQGKQSSQEIDPQLLTKFEEIRARLRREEEENQRITTENSRLKDQIRTMTPASSPRPAEQYSPSEAQRRANQARKKLG